MRTVATATARILVAVLASLGVLLALSVPASAAVGSDDYPYKTQTNTTAADKWGFTQRQCVSFVAWRMAQAGRPVTTSQGYGSALNWDEVAKSKGKVISTVPRVGAVVQWNPTEKSGAWLYGSSTMNGTITASSYGHVATVQHVYSDGSVLIEQYNMGGNRSYSKMRIKRLTSGATHRYLYL